MQKLYSDLLQAKRRRRKYWLLGFLCPGYPTAGETERGGGCTYESYWKQGVMVLVGWTLKTLYWRHLDIVLIVDIGGGKRG